MDGCIHLLRRDVAYTFSDIHRPDSYMGGLRLLTCFFSLINHSNVRFYLHHQRSTTTSELDKSVYHYSSPSASTPSQRRRPDYVYSERADCLWQCHRQWEEINNNVTLSIVLPSNCTSHTTSLREQRKLAIAREEVVVVIQWIILVAVICLVLEINLIKNLILKVALSLLIQHI